MKTLESGAWSPRTLVDGRVFPTDLTTICRAHRQNDVPILVGWNAEEGKDLAPALLGTSDFRAGNYRALVAKLLGHEPSPALLATYPAATDAQVNRAIGQLTNDWWGWRMWYWAGLQKTYGKVRPYVYFFAHEPAPPAKECAYGCGIGHGVEIRYVFNNLGQGHRQWTDDDRALASRLADTWVAFARTGRPDGQGLPTWPAFDGSPESIMRIGTDADLERYGALPDFRVFPPVPRN